MLIHARSCLLSLLSEVDIEIPDMGHKGILVFGKQAMAVTLSPRLLPCPQV